MRNFGNIYFIFSLIIIIIIFSYYQKKKHLLKKKTSYEHTFDVQKFQYQRLLRKLILHFPWKYLLNEASDVKKCGINPCPFLTPATYPLFTFSDFVLIFFFFFNFIVWNFLVQYPV